MGQRIKSFPRLQRNVTKPASIKTRHGEASVSHSCAEVPLIKCSLSGFDHETRRTRGKKRVLQFEFGGAVECNRAQRLRFRPALAGGGGNRLVERSQQRYLWNSV